MHHIWMSAGLCILLDQPPLCVPSCPSVLQSSTIIHSSMIYSLWAQWHVTCPEGDLYPLITTRLRIGRCCSCFSKIHDLRLPSSRVPDLGCSFNVFSCGKIVMMGITGTFSWFEGWLGKYVLVVRLFLGQWIYCITLDGADSCGDFCKSDRSVSPKSQ